MPVKPSQSAARVLTLLETVASHQPIGVRALAKLLQEDKSAVHRALVTLTDHGWVRTTHDTPVRWEVTARILAVAHAAHGGNDLWRRARSELEQLRDETEETVLLVVPDVRNFVVADVLESRQTLRVVLGIGTLVEAKRTATGRAILPFLDVQRQTELLGGPPDRKLLELHERTRELGYATSEGEVNPVTTSLASAIFDFVGRPIGAVVVCGPRERLTKNVQKKVGIALVRAARRLSGGVPGGVAHHGGGTG